MAKTFRPSLFLRTSNKIVALLLRAGVNMGTTTLLTVRGRKSGQPRTTPVTLIEREGQSWLVAPYGSVNWVRNLRAAGEANLTRGRRTEHISAVELNVQEAAPILKHALSIAPSFLLAYFDVTADSSLADIASEAPLHPVFQVKSLSNQQSANKNTPVEKAML